MDLIDYWKKHRDGAQGEHRKYLASLRKTKGKSVNALAAELHDRVFSEIDCLDCAHCCQSVPPLVNENDIRRAARFLRMKPLDFEVRYVSHDEDGDRVMRQTPCSFLESDNRCRIYEARPKACREYPHTGDREFLKNLRLHSANTYYCPAVFHLIEYLKVK